MKTGITFGTLTGCEIVYLPCTPSISTTELIERIRG